MTPQQEADFLAEVSGEIPMGSAKVGQFKRRALYNDALKVVEKGENVINTSNLDPKNQQGNDDDDDEWEDVDEEN